MASGKLSPTHTILSGNISSSSQHSLKGGAAAGGGGSADHNRLTNRDKADQHPIEAITDLRKELDSKLDSNTALPLIEEAVQNKAKGLYFDAKKELARKSYWYLTAEIDPVTNMGTKESIISGPYDLGAGGGSGGGGVTKVSIRPVKWPSTVVVGSKAVFSVTWSSTVGDAQEPTGDGTFYVSVNDKQVLVLPNKSQGVVELDLSDYLIAGTNNIKIKVLDAYGTTGTLVRTTNAVTLELKSSFNETLNFKNFINYTYIPYGDVEKTVYFIVDGKEKGTQVVNSTGEQQTYRIEGLTHGSHTLKVYFTATINGELVTSNELFYDLVYYVEGNTTPIIVSTFTDLEQEQYIAFNIPYRVYIDGRNEFEVSFLVNDEEVNKTTVGTSEQYWNYVNNTPGNYKLTIKCGATTKDFNIYIKPTTINVTPVAQDLALALSTQGRNNNEDISTRTQWKDEKNNIECTLTNFNWKSNGWVNDVDGNTVLRVSGDARVTIPYKAFEADFKNSGKTIELEIATSAVRNYSATLISCLDKQSTDFYDISTSFAEEESRRYTFKVNLDVSKIKDEHGSSKLTPGSHVFSYTANGWILDSEILVNLDDYGISISQYEINPEGTHSDAFLLIGDNIIVNYTLAARGFYVTPQLAGFRSQQSFISTQYKEDEHVRLSFVIEKNTENRIIWMYINGIASGAMQYPVDDNFRQLDSNIIEIGSNDAILDIYNIRVYNNSLTSKQIVNNWIADTQSIALKAERFTRNDNYNDKNEIIASKLPTGLPYIVWDIQPLPEFKGDKRLGNAIYVDPKDPSRNFTSERAQYNVQGTSSSVYPTKNIRIKFKAKDGDPNFFWVNDNGDTIKKFPITYPGGIGANYFTFKVDYASSEGANNVELTKLYNDACIAMGILTPPQRQDLKVRVGIDGFPVAAFYRNEEGKDVFCTKANFNNDKANEDVYGFADGDESWETTNNSADEAKYKVPSTEDNFGNGFEIRFPDSDDWNGDLTKLKAMTTWVASTNRDLATNEELAEPVTYTYKETILGEDNSETTKEVTKTFTHDTKEYRLIKFRAELADWFNVDSTLFYYVFTHIYLMIDSRAKNAFPTYFKSRQAGDGGDRWFWIPYDMDTAIGIDNKGKLSFDYNLEDTDQLDGADVYNGQDSVMWCNLRDSMPGEIKAMYAKMRLSKLISYEETEKRFEEHQDQWSESIFNEDAKNKYIAPLANGDNYLEMLQGSKAQQRKWWLYNRFKYMDSKYNAGEAIKDFIQFRAYVDSGVEKPKITITPYADIYATVSYANGRVVAKRAKRNEQIIIENPFSTAETENDQETYIYSASQLKSIGDISGFHPDTVKIGNAIKLQELKVGDKDPNYQNPYLKELTVGGNTLLRSIDARNCVNLGTGVTSAPDLSQCINIEEIYFTGTKIKGIILPDGGNIKKLHLPGTLTSLTIKNQPLLADLNIEDTSLIESLWLENIPSTSIHSETMVGNMKPNTAVRLIGINEIYNSYEEIKHFYDILDTKKGLTADGETTEKAQVTGTIHIPYSNPIAYADWKELSDSFPEITIDAKIVCTVTFYNDGVEHFTTNVVSGMSAETPTVPRRAPTEQFYYTFNSWDKSYSNVVTDLDINAVYDEHIQVYHVIFDTRSDLITVEPESIDILYNELIPEPTIDESTKPEGVTFLGWYTTNNDLVDFSSQKVLGNIIKFPETMDIRISARWQDENHPVVRCSRLAFNKFGYHATDNLGITAWAVTDSEAITLEDERWNMITSTTVLDGEYEISAAGDYYFHVKDDQGNISWDKIHASTITLVQDIHNERDDSQNIITLKLSENDKYLTDFAINGTVAIIDAVVDDHYDNLVLTYNNQIIEHNNEILIDHDAVIYGSVYPKSYTVSFVSEMGATPESQTVIYKHLVEEPDPQVIEGYILDRWAINEETWDFDTSEVYKDIVLTAKWIEYSEPTIFTVSISEPNTTVTLNLEQSKANGVKVTWNLLDGEQIDETNNTAGQVSFTHTYAEPGPYTIQVLRQNGTYLLGKNNDESAIMPAAVLTDIQFAFDVATTKSGAFRFAVNLVNANLTRFMTSIASNMFDGCSRLATLYNYALKLPDAITTIESAAFRDCVSLSGVTLPAKLRTLGDNAFRNCSNITAVIFEQNCPLTVIQDYAFFACERLERITLPKNLTTIKSNAFSSCTTIEEIQLPATVVNIGDSVFSYCENLSHIVIPAANMMSFGTCNFEGCRQLQTAGPLGGNYNVEFGWDNKIPAGAFSTSAYNAPITINRIVLPSTITELGDKAFFNCNSLLEIKLPTNLSVIGENCFTYCWQLQNIDIPGKVTTIGNNAFDHCTSLRDANLWCPNSANKIEAPENAWFTGTSRSLLTVHILSTISTMDAKTLYGTYWDVHSAAESGYNYIQVTNDL